LPLRFEAGDRVESGERFIQKQHRRIGREGACDADPLLLAAGKLRRVARRVHRERQAQCFEQLGNAGANPVFGPSAKAWDKPHVPFHGHVGEQPAVLNDVADPAAQFDGVPFEYRSALEANVAARGRDEAIDRFEQCRLPRAATSEQHERFSLLDAEIDIPEYREFADVVTHIPKLDHCRHIRSFHGTREGMGKLSADADLRGHLIALLEGGNAHITFVDAVKDFPVERAGIRPQGSPHSVWELLEHLRIAQADIVLFTHANDYVELKWPDDYWPSASAPKDEAEWNASVEAVGTDLARFIDMLKDERRDLFEPFPWGNGQTLLREALLIADHNSYHVGQLMLLRRMLESGRT
jgi:hypothetical protein